MSNSQISFEGPRKVHNGTYFNKELPLAVPVPKPCTTAEMEFAANKHLADTFDKPVDVAKFPTTLDIAIVKGLLSGEIAVEDAADPVIIYNKNNGSIYKQDFRSRYYYINVHDANGRKAHLPVHRIVYYNNLCLRNKLELLGAKFDIHHIDGNPANNHAANVAPVPRALHSSRGAFQNFLEGAFFESQLLAVRMDCSNEYAAGIIIAMRVILQQFKRGSSLKGPVYTYFAQVLQTTKDYAWGIGCKRRCKRIPDATPKQAEQILTHYHWIFEQFEANNNRYDTVLAEPEGFKHLTFSLFGDKQNEQERQESDLKSNSE